MTSSPAWSFGRTSTTRNCSGKRTRRSLSPPDGNPPPILDPFAGGGSIPLEAQRLGLEAHASDLNPVAVLINKALIEIPPKWAVMRLFSRVPQRRRCLGQVRLASPKTCAATASGCATRPRSASVTCTRRSRSPGWTPRSSPGSGPVRLHVPTRPAQGRCRWFGQFWLGKKKGKERYVVPIPDGKRVRFEIGGPDWRSARGNGRAHRRRLPICDTLCRCPTSASEGKAGRMGAQLMAIVAEGKRQRYYVAPNDEHEIGGGWSHALTTCPRQSFPLSALGFRVRATACDTWADLFTNRQLTALTTFSELV